MPIPLHALIVEDSEDDALLMARELRRGGYDPTFVRVETPDAMTAELDKQVWKIVICDYVMPHFSAPAALSLFTEKGFDLPFIVITGKIGEETAVATMKAGAHDVILKDNLSRLVPAVERELREAEERRARREAEEALRFSRFCIDRAGDATFWMGSDAQLFYVNAAACKSLGYTREELLSMTVHDLDPACPLEAWSDHWKEIKQRGSLTYETHHRAKDARMFPVEISANYFEFEGREGNFIFARDITERKRVEEGLERFARQQSAMAEVGSLAVGGEKMKDLMDTAVRLTAEVLGVELCGIFELEEPGEALRLVAGVGFHEGLIGEATIGVEPDSQAAYILGEGGPVVVTDLRSEHRFSVPRLLEEHGVVSGLSVPMVAEGFFVFGIMELHTTQQRDFSEDDGNFLETMANVITTAVLRRRVEGALREAHEELQQAYETLEEAQASAILSEKLAAVGRLTAGVSHEILNPLNVITLGLHILINDPKTPPEINSTLKEMNEQAGRITKITQDLLSFSRQRPLERLHFDLNETIKRTLGLLEHDLRQKKITVELQLSNKVPPVLADQDQLQQVILNLLTNARDVMPDGGRLVLTTAGVEPLFADKERAVELRVEDTGPGIAPEDMDKLFEPFFTTKDIGEGTGLGLSICQGIVEGHGGSIWAENLNGGGAAFVVRLEWRDDNGKENLGS